MNGRSSLSKRVAAFLVLAMLIGCPCGALAADESESSTKASLKALGFSQAPKEGGKGQTSLFGLVGEGYKFAFVFDRSGSMGEMGALAAVKAEVLRSLDNLDTVHQFQIIYYNQRPTVFSPSGVPGQLVFATDQNKQRAIGFVESVKPDGGTDHEAALRAAVRLKPDVIFLMTDADDPKLSAKELKAIRRMAAGTIIHAIEFGQGDEPPANRFLEELAGQNGGEYRYVDIKERSANESDR